MIWSPNRSRFGGSCARRRCRSSVIAGADAAHVVAVGIELAHPAATAIAVPIISVVAGGDRAADDGGADDAGSNAPAKAERLCIRLMRRGGERPGGNESGKGEGCDFGLDRHGKLHPVEGGPLWSACPVGRRLSDSGSNRRRGNRIKPESIMIPVACCVYSGPLASFITSKLSTSASNSQNARAP